MKILITAISLTLLAGAVACHEQTIKHSGKLTKSNVAKIQKGMTVSDVEAVFGDDDTRKAGMAPVGGIDVPADQRMWKEGDTWIVVSFVGGQVVGWDQRNVP